MPGLALPQSTAVLYLQPSGIYLATSSGVSGELPVTVPVTDGVCTDDLDPNGNETTSDAQALAQDVYHIILEELGSNLDDPNRGIGADGYLSASSATLAALPSTIDSQLRKDTRIDSSKSTLTTDASGAWTLQVQLVATGSVIPLGFAFDPSTGLVQL